jgi:hypothetical protein
MLCLGLAAGVELESHPPRTAADYFCEAANVQSH